MPTIMIDCPQEIPCNPCKHICKVGAIGMDTLIQRPLVFSEKCIGCDNCVASCPGQACFLIDENYSDTEATIDFPFEFLPVPEVGELRYARNNNGDNVCVGRVEAVLKRKAWMGTLVIRLAVEKKYVRYVRGMSRERIN